MTTSERYSNLVDAKLRNELVLKDGTIFNNRYEGDPKAGVVKVHKTAASTVADYDKTKGVVPSAVTDEWIAITINKDKVVNEIVDGYDAAAIPDGIVADRLDTAGYGIASALDKDGAVELATNGTAFGDTTALTKTTIYSNCVDARTAMSKAGVPVTGRYAIMTPDVYALALKSSEFVEASALGDSVKATGALGSIAGFAIYESANLPDKVEMVFGHPDYAARVKEWSVPVHVQSLDASGNFVGASAVQGRYVYAHKVTDPAAILVKKTA